MAYRSRRAPARRSSGARRSYSAGRRTPVRRSVRRSSGSRRSSGVQTVKLVIQAGPTQSIADPGTGAVVKKAGKARF